MDYRPHASRIQSALGVHLCNLLMGITLILEYGMKILHSTACTLQLLDHLWKFVPQITVAGGAAAATYVDSVGIVAMYSTG